MFKVSTLARIPQTLALLFGFGSLALTGSLLPATASEAETITAVSPNQTYLYGETPDANQPGQGYIVFQRQGDTIMGAFYYPQSEYSCFAGKMKGNDLQVLSLPTHSDPISSFSLSLSELTAIPDVGSQELQTLASCRQEVTAFLNENRTALKDYGLTRQ